MTNACHAVGVKVIVDIVINHMSGINSGSGVAGSTFTHYVYPGIYQYSDFHHCGLTPNDQIVDFNNEAQVETCQLVNLADLNTESEYVRQRLANHLNDVLSLGVDGFRIDAAKHIAPASVLNILGRLSRKVYITQEVVDTQGRFSNLHKSAGDIQEFRFAYTLLDAFQKSGISSLINLNNYGWIASNQANVFVSNHDTERGGSSLSYKSSNNMYTLGHVFMLAFPYGTPTVHSGFMFSSSDEGAPDGGACSGNGPTGKWVCEHRLTAVVGMVGFLNTVGSAAVTDVFTTSDKQQLAFGRGASGYVAINNSGSVWQATFKTSLPAGTYCDVVSGAKASAACTGARITVADGSFTYSVSPGQAIAIHVGARL